MGTGHRQESELPHYQKGKENLVWEGQWVSVKERKDYLFLGDDRVLLGPVFWKARYLEETEQKPGSRQWCSVC